MPSQAYIIEIGSDAFTIYDAILLFTGTIFTLVFVTRTLAGMGELRAASAVGGAGSRCEPGR